VAGPAAQRGRHLLERRVHEPWIGNTARERIAHGPEAVAAGAEAERVDGLEFVTAQDGHFGVIGAVRAAGLAGNRRAFGDLAAEAGEDIAGIAFPCAAGCTRPGGRDPLIVGDGHSMNIGRKARGAQDGSREMEACRLGER